MVVTHHFPSWGPISTRYSTLVGLWRLIISTRLFTGQAVWRVGEGVDARIRCVDFN